MTIKWLGRVSVFGLLFAGVCFAQEAQITGRVTDSTGAVLPDVKVTITNADTGITRETKTNDLGYYTVPLLDPGHYKLTAEKQGFGTREQTGIELLVDQ